MSSHELPRSRMSSPSEEERRRAFRSWARRAERAPAFLRLPTPSDAFCTLPRMQEAERLTRLVLSLAHPKRAQNGANAQHGAKAAGRAAAPAAKAASSSAVSSSAAAAADAADDDDADDDEEDADEEAEREAERAERWAKYQEAVAKHGLPGSAPAAHNDGGWVAPAPASFCVLLVPSECLRVLPSTSECFRVLPSASESFWFLLLRVQVGGGGRSPSEIAPDCD